MVLRYAQFGFDTAARLAGVLPCPLSWLRPGFETALGWIALPFVQRVSGIGPNTAATVDRLGAQLRDLEAVLGRYAQESDTDRAARRRRARRRLQALEHQATAERARADAMERALDSLRRQVDAIPELLAEREALRSHAAAQAGDIARLEAEVTAVATAAEQRLVAATAEWHDEQGRLARLSAQLEAQLRAVASSDDARSGAAAALAAELERTLQDLASERSERAGDTAAQLAALDAGWTARVTELDQAWAEHAAGLAHELDMLRGESATNAPILALVPALEGEVGRLTHRLQLIDADRAAHAREAAHWQAEANSLASAAAEQLANATVRWTDERTALLARAAALDADLRTMVAAREQSIQTAEALGRELEALRQQHATERTHWTADATLQLAALEAGWSQRASDLGDAATERLAEASRQLETLRAENSAQTAAAAAAFAATQLAWNEQRAELNARAAALDNDLRAAEAAEQARSATAADLARQIEHLQREIVAERAHHDLESSHRLAAVEAACQQRTAELEQAAAAQDADARQALDAVRADTAAEAAAANEAFAAAQRDWDEQRMQLAARADSLEVELRSARAAERAYADTARTLAERYDQQSNDTITERTQRARDGAEHVLALDAGWRQRTTDLHQGWTEQLAEATQRLEALGIQATTAAAAAADQFASERAAWDAQHAQVTEHAATLGTELRTARAAEQARADAATALAQQLDRLQHEIAAERAQLALDGRQRLTELEDGWRQRTAELEHGFAERLTTANAQIEALELAVARHAAAEDALQAQLAARDHELRTLAATMQTTTEAATRQALATAAERDEERRQSTSVRERLETQLATLTAANHQRTREVAALQVEAKGREERAVADRLQVEQAATAERDRLADEWSERQAARDASWTQRLADASATVEALRLDNNRYRRTIDDLEQTISQLRTDRDHLAARVEGNRTQALTLIDQVSQLEASATAMREQVAAAEASAAARWQQWADELSTRMATERGVQEADLADYRRRVDTLTRTSDDLRQEHHAALAAHASAIAAAEREHERLRGQLQTAEQRLSGGDTGLERARRAHESALADAYQTISEREQDLEQMRQRAQRLEVARAAAAEEARRLREGLREGGGIGSGIASAIPAAAREGAGTVAGAIARLLKSGPPRTPPDDESNRS